MLKKFKEDILEQLSMHNSGAPPQKSVNCTEMLPNPATAYAQNVLSANKVTALRMVPYQVHIQDLIHTQVGSIQKITTVRLDPDLEGSTPGLIHIQNGDSTNSASLLMSPSQLRSTPSGRYPLLMCKC